MLRLLFVLALLLVTTAASAQPDTARNPLIVDGDFGPATLAIDYEQRRGDLRRATLTLAPTSEDAKPIPHGAIEQIGVLSKGNGWIIIQSFLSSGHTTSIQAQAMLPAPTDISMILIKPRRGPWYGWKIEEGEGYTEVEWTYFNQRGREVRSAPCEPNACFGNVTDAFNQAESTASSFRVEISGIVKSGGGSDI